MTALLAFALLSALWLPVWLNGKVKGTGVAVALVAAWAATVIALAFAVLVSSKGWPS